MNVSIYKPKIRLAFLALLLLPMFGWSQDLFYELVEVPKNDSLDYHVKSVGSPILSLSPSNGLVNIDLDGVYPNYNIEYVPFNGYVGRDTFSFVYGVPPFGTQSITRVIEVEVLPAFVSAGRDFAVTAIDLPVTFDVLTNDTGSDSIYFSNISLANGGIATYDTASNGVTFTPNPGFEGVAHFNYTACVSPDHCDVGVATVFVEGSATIIDTVRIATKRGKGKRLLLPLTNGYQELDAASNGTVSVVSDGQLEYIPNANFFNDQDQFTFAYNTFTNTSLRTFVVEVLDTDLTSTLGISKGDFAFVPINGTVDIDVLANDNQILNPSINSVVEVPQNGTATIVNGQIQYVPNAGFNGVDVFTYKACMGAGSGCENAEVIVTVDNMYPSSTTFNLTTIENTPLVINYNLPFGDFDFINVPEQSLDGGYIDFFETFDGFIDGQYISGNNIIIYTPPVGYAASDRFEFDYCPGTDDCELIKINVDVLDMGAPNDTFCIAECVWSGDADNNGTVDITDMLPVGYSTGEIGPIRTNANMSWYGQFGDRWNQDITQMEVNLKHVDTNGDGVISVLDTAAISQSYGLSHNLTPGNLPTISDLPLFFVPKTAGPYNPGDKVLIDVVLGNTATPAVDINGLTFAMNYNSAIVKPGTFKIDFDNRSWMAYNSPMLDMVKYPFIGRAEAGYTRTSGLAASGSGRIATVEFIVEDIIDGVKQGDRVKSTVSTQATSMNGSGLLQTLPVYNIQLEIITVDQDRYGLKEDDLLAFPNPAQDVLNIHVNGKNEIREFSIFSITGQEMMVSGKIHVKNTQVDISILEDGLYILNAITENGIVSKKFEVIHEPFR
ncbi:MAG: Ig-like domain-containing protein [Bacteroidota bacterium]